jgi:3-hydroxyacyl-CoA dehydrogenase
LAFIEFLKNKVEQNQLGLKSQYGFYDYSKTYTCESTANKQLVIDEISKAIADAKEWSGLLLNQPNLNLFIDEYLGLY